MPTHTEKPSESKTRSDTTPSVKGSSQTNSTFQFADNRPQAKRTLQLQAIANNHSGKHQNPIQKKPNKTGLPDNLKAGIENLSGYSMDDVKVHYNSAKPAALQAHAYAQDTNIHLASGQEKHLPHEAWHVVQQKQGRVKPTLQMKTGVNVNDDKSLEKEADIMGIKSLKIKSKENRNQSINSWSLQNMSSTQFEKNNNNNEKNVTQLYRVSDDHIRADLRHGDSNKLFLRHTITDIEERLKHKISSAVPNEELEEAVSKCRENGMMDYNQLSKRKLSSEKQITSFLNEKPEDEHMYVLDNNEHHVAIRNESKKLPHPTLVGGDPDVDCAGTMRWGIDGAVVVDDGSGHFRPGGAKPAETNLNKIMNKTAKKSFSKKIKGGKRE
ncbi:DUF4157 domain-containing protein [Owenweeksia hongkongensis]|uniref:eCIS core domain-containing protein n=1 Tax=Owenweeksia hongkongensis TaxID=253245 RepID=UPI003A8CCC6C